jgi:hypothetical protein
MEQGDGAVEDADDLDDLGLGGQDVNPGRRAFFY